MPTNLTQLDDPERNKLVLRVEGSMTHEDAVLLEKIALDMRSREGKNITIDLADLTFIDSDSAPIIKRIEREHGFELEGLEIFLQKAVDDNEANS
jgi:anti-anti-sigma regulatory factor